MELELNLLEFNKNRVKELAGEKLKLYNEILTEQKIKIESELYMLKSNNELIYRGMCTKIANKAKFLKAKEFEWNDKIHAIKDEIKLLKNSDHYLKKFLDDYLDDLNDDFPFVYLD